MYEDNITSETLDESSQLNDASVEQAVENSPEVPTPETLSLKEINDLLGKDFKDKGTALKAVKDTFSYVGKKREDIAKEVLGNSQVESLTREMKQLKENAFYDKNPELESYRPLIQKLGDNPADVIGSPEFKAIYEKAKGYDESAKMKTVLQSSPRLASVRDNFAKAQEAMKSGNREEAESLIARTALETME